MSLSVAPDNSPTDTLEYLDLSSSTPEIDTGFITVTYNGTLPSTAASPALGWGAGALSLNLTDARAYLTRFPDLAAATAAASDAFGRALKKVVYQHVGKRPDPTPRPVLFTLTDLSGAISLPGLARVIIDMSSPQAPWFDLNGPQSPIRTPYVATSRDSMSYLRDLYYNVSDDGSFATAYSSLERSEGVAICDYTVTLQVGYTCTEPGRRNDAGV